MLVSCHNPYFNRWFSAIEYVSILDDTFIKVTILILIDGFLQSKHSGTTGIKQESQSLF